MAGVTGWVVRARSALDAAAAAYADPKPTCGGVGCAGCCTGPIMAHPDELVDVLPRVTRAQRNAARLVAGLHEDYRCPLLDPATRRCTVYDARPLVCRGMAVTSPPAHCTPGHPGKVTRHPEALVAWNDAVEGSGLSVGAYHDGVVELARALAELPDERLTPTRTP